MKTEQVPPNVGNFVESLRDVGYTFEVAVADILDNSISAGAKCIDIYAAPKVAMDIHDIEFCILDDGEGMTESELTEAMRLSCKNPNDTRNEKDLGRFGLGLKTASFSQCRKLTVLSKKNDSISIKQWDLDHISQQNSWLLITPDINEFKDIDLIKKLNASKNGTLVIWQKIDSINHNEFTENLCETKKHLSLVFHRFLEDRFNNLSISINNDKLTPLNPYNIEHNATQEKPLEVIKVKNSEVKVTPYILPHHSKVSQQQWEKYATDEGYIKSQGFYLYRAKRLLIYGTWWGMHKATDAHKLVRIKIDISNNQDQHWGIDIKKSHAKPRRDIKDKLKRIIKTSTEIGSRPYTGRGKKIQDKTTIKFWQTIPVDNDFRFGLNKEHPLYQKIKENSSNFKLLDCYLKGLEAYLPLEAIQSHLQENPHKIKQKSALSDEDIDSLIERLEKEGSDKEYVESLLKTEFSKTKIKGA
jgi:hypothetical protein